VRSALLVLVGLAGCDELFGLDPIRSSPSDAAGDAMPDAMPDVPLPPVGCADGQRDGFIDRQMYPRIAACSGGWELMGVKTARSGDATCGDSGDDGVNQTGRMCSVANLCAAGWHVCIDPGDVSLSLGGAPGCDTVTKATSSGGGALCCLD